jgi:hypothetical protein
LEKKFTTRVEDQRLEGRKIQEARTGFFERCVENTQSGKAGRIGVLLIVWIQDIDKDAKKLND